jgi:heme exporter protein A
VENTLNSIEISVNSASCYKNNNIVFNNVNFKVKDYDVGLITGPNGCGKTTLIKALCGIQNLESGEILFNNVNIKDSKSIFFENLVYVGHKNSLNNDLTIIENLEYLSALDNSAHKTDNNVIEKAMNFFDIYKYRDYMVSDLSEGNKKKASLSRLLISQKKIWVLDEPLSNLDEGAIKNFINLILSHQKKGGITIASTHNDFSGNIKNIRHLKMVGNK